MADPPDTAAGGAGYVDRARDHLANERTFLAWVRTALAALALGIALEHFGQDGNAVGLTVLAGVLVAGSSVVLVGATVRYYRVAAGLDRGRYRVNALGPLVVTFGLVAVAVIALLLGR